MLKGDYIKRADTDSLRNVFNKYASFERNGLKFMTDEDFVIKFLGLYDENNYNKKTVQSIARILDTNKDGYISFAEFQAFEGLLCYPDALYRTAFLLFDLDASGHISFEEFASIIKETRTFQKIPFNFESTLIHSNFGRGKNRHLSFLEFSQFLHDFHDYYSVVAFTKSDTDGTGFITAEQFREIMLSTKKHLLTKVVRDKVIETSSMTHGDLRISFAQFMAFTTLLGNMELIKRVYLNATNGSRTIDVTKAEFQHSAQMMSQITPLEIDSLFTVCAAIRTPDDRVCYKDLQKITPEQYFKKVTRLAEIRVASTPDERGVFVQILESAYRFVLGAIAGCFGAAAVYPIDFVKTRMQNQRVGADGKKLYANSWDCFQKVVKNETVFGLYKGMPPVLIGVAPEKAIKLAVNDFVRDKITNESGYIPLVGEMFAGGCAGFCQVVATCPLEIVKIRLQMAGEQGQTAKAWDVVKQLGIKGLFQGYQACWLRDISFSAIYFPVYAHTKLYLADDNGYNHPLTLLLAGAIAGMPAASMVTPFDVIKTRIQSIPRKGETVYHGVIDATGKIYREEGFKAFWKGVIPRVCRSSPQFGVTLVVYEVLQRLFYVDFAGTRPAGSDLNLTTALEEGKAKAYHIGGYKVAIPVLNGLESKFGINLPKFGFKPEKKEPAGG